MYLNAKQRNHRMAGYTLDQTILIVAVIAILVTIIIATMGWQLLARAGGTKLASHLRQIETANGQFYADHAVWPYEATDGSPTATMRLMLGDELALAPNSGLAAADLKNYLPSYENDGTNVKHPFGSGGNVGEAVEEMPDTNQNYLTITFDEVPSTEAMEADESIDGKNATDGATKGRVQYAAGAKGASKVTLKYYANVVN